MKSFHTVATAVLMIGVLAPGRASIYRVDSRSKAVAPDGASWATAYSTVRAALTHATARDEVWVATGTYSESIKVPVDVALYGGFAGVETTRDARDAALNVTTLQGTGSGGAGPASASVVTLPASATASTVLDGFTITGGGGTIIQTLVQSGACSGRGGGGWRKVFLVLRGGGVFVAGGFPTIANNVIAGNSTAHSAMTGAVGCHSVATYYQAGNGGGIYVAPGAIPLISGNLLQNNSAQNGGAVYCDGGVALISGNTITGNTALVNGGGVAGAVPAATTAGRMQASFSLTGNNVLNNSAGADGGGVSGFADIRDNLFQGNVSAGNGAGMDGGGRLSDNKFMGNAATKSGGGVHASLDCSIKRCTFLTNTALDGAGVASEGGLRSLRNSVFADNVASHSAAAMVLGGSAVIANVTVANNTSPLGSVVLNGNPTDYSQRMLFVNNIVASNQSGLSTQGARVNVRGNDVWNNTDGNYLTSYSLIGTTGEISQDPMFVDATGGNYHLRPNSICVDSGDTNLVPATSTDLEGAPRIQGKGVDMGAFETAGALFVAPTGPIHVASGGDDTNDGSTWTSALATVQYALDASIARGGAEIWVAKGAYAGPFTAFAPMQLYGGFAGTENSRSQRIPGANETVFDGLGAAPVLTAGFGEPGLSDGFTMDGFDVKNGHAASGGGGITCAQVTVTIANNIVENNSGAEGAGIDVGAAGGFVTQNVIRNNQAAADAGLPHNGGGVFAGPAITLQANTITGNASDSGGGVYGAGSVTANTISGNTALTGGGLYSCGLVSRNIINGNTATWAGGGVELAGTIEDNLIAQNVCGSFGGGADIQSGTKVLNNTFTGNTSSAEVTDTGTGAGGALSIQYGGGIVTPDAVTNNIIAFNSSGITMLNLNTTFSHNDVFSNTDADYNGLSAPAGTLSVDPLFVNRNGHDYRLQAGSPCIDAGDDTAVTLGALDLIGNPRKIGTHVDIGAYEFLAAGSFSIADASRALEIAGGLVTATPADAAHLEVMAGPISAGDAVVIARKAVGLDPNP